MSEFKGTKGKWEYVENSWDVTTISCNDQEICMLTADEEECMKSPEREEEILLMQMANAQLISKAPEMLEMLKDILDCQKNGEVFHSYQIEQLIKEATEL